MRATRRLAALAGAGALIATMGGVPLQSASAVPTVFMGAGNASVTAAINAFTAAIGGGNNGTAPPPAANGFRRINWDAVPINASNEIVPSKVGDVAVDQFQGRGVIFDDDTAVANDGFLSTNPSVTAAFPAFTSPLVFSPYNDNQVLVTFVLASTRGTTPIPAASKGFGAVFLDVESANTTIEFFHGTTSLRKDIVPVAGHGESAFLGVVFDSPVVTSVLITLGTARIFDFPPVSAGGNENEGDDLVALDDFVYGEPMCTRTYGAVVTPTVVASTGDIVCLNGTTVNGSIVANPGSVVVMNNGFVAVNITANGAAFLSVCGTTVRGSVTAQNTTGFVRIGDAANDDNLNCGGNNIRGDVSVLNGRGGFEVGGNQISANLTANDNQALRLSGPLAPAGDDLAEIEGNYVGGALTCLRNVPTPTDDERPNQVIGSTANCTLAGID